MKKVLIGVVVLLAIVVGVSVFVVSSLDGIVKGAIETYGSEATGTRVSVADVKIRMKSGEGTIRGLNIANPGGFSDPNIFELGMISARINTDTLMQNPVIIEKVSIRSPAVFYEINKSGVSNVDVLRKNLGGSGGGPGGTARSGGGEQLKMIIRKLVVEGGKVRVRIAALGNREQNVNIPAIRLANVGKKSGGVTAAEVAQILGKHLVKNVKASVATLGVRQYLGKSADAFKKGALDKIGRVGGGLGKAVGGAAGHIGGALKGLLGK